MAQKGSPPRMRGKACQLREIRICHRITPAYAGKSSGSSVKVRFHQDHPRVCGEKSAPLVMCY